MSIEGKLLKLTAGIMFTSTLAIGGAIKIGEQSQVKPSLVNGKISLLNQKIRVDFEDFVRANHTDLMATDDKDFFIDVVDVVKSKGEGLYKDYYSESTNIIDKKKEVSDIIGDFRDLERMKTETHQQASFTGMQINQATGVTDFKNDEDIRCTLTRDFNVTRYNNGSEISNSRHINCYSTSSDKVVYAINDKTYYTLDGYLEGVFIPDEYDLRTDPEYEKIVDGIEKLMEEKK